MDPYFAPTLPPMLYPALDKGKYHLVQAHHLMDDPGDGVINWFRSVGHGSGHVTILDNGVIESGEPRIDDLMAMIDVLKPSAAICPDAFNDYDETLELFYEYAPVLAGMVPTSVYVPHGSSVAQWCTCVDEMIDNAPGNFIIGVPKVLTTYAGGRWTALAYLSEHYPNVSTHLLGTWYGMGEVVECVQWFDNILGFDSTLPFAHAVHGIDTAVHPNEKCTLDYTSITEFSTEAICRAKLNISTIRKLLEPSVPNVLCYPGLLRWASGPNLAKPQR